MKYCFRVPIAHENGMVFPRGIDTISAAYCIYDENMQYAYVITNNKYYLKRKYAELMGGIDFEQAEE